MPQLVVFDLDETITRHDTLLPYAMGYVIRHQPWRLPLFATVAPPTVEYLLGRTDEGRVKESFIKAALGGSSRSDIDAWTSRFVPPLIARGTFAKAMERIAEHRRAGDHLVLMSARRGLSLSPTISRELGFNETICTGVRWDGDRLNGSLTTPNRKGEEKARCFIALREQHPGLDTTAYGNSSTDLPHLRLATHGFLVNGSEKARRTARDLGVTCVDWA